MPRYLTTKETAVIFRRSVRTIYRWINEGKTFQHVVKVRDGYLIPETEVQRIMEQQKTESYLF